MAAGLVRGRASPAWGSAWTKARLLWHRKAFLSVKRGSQENCLHLTHFHINFLGRKTFGTGLIHSLSVYSACIWITPSWKQKRRKNKNKNHTILNRQVKPAYLQRNENLFLVTAESYEKAITDVPQQTTYQRDQVASYRREIVLTRDTENTQETQMVKPTLSCHRHVINVTFSNLFYHHWTMWSFHGCSQVLSTSMCLYAYPVSHAMPTTGLLYNHQHLCLAWATGYPTSSCCAVEKDRWLG